MENFKKIKLLIIESNSVDAEALMDIFGDCNDIAIYGAYELEAQWVKNIEDAQERLKEFQFDMIFQDLDLSNYHGCKSLKIIKSLAPNVPIIVTTGYINRKLWQEAFTEGAQDFILKTSVNSQLIIKTIFYTFERLKYQHLHEVR